MNINIEIEDINIEDINSNKSITQNSTQSNDMNEFSNFDDFFLQDCENNENNLLFVKKIDYMENYRVEDLKKIAKYYEIPIKRKKKEDLVEEIIVYEDCLENLEKVQRRLHFWNCLEELNLDPYFKQFVVF